MLLEADVEQFLLEFKAKLKVFGVIFMDRDKNFKTLVELELTTVNRSIILEQLTVKDYYKGPTQDYNDGPALWEFGKKIKQRDVYVKITLGAYSRPVICISFHIAERPIKYPFK